MPFSGRDTQELTIISGTASDHEDEPQADAFLFEQVDRFLAQRVEILRARDEKYGSAIVDAYSFLATKPAFAKMPLDQSQALAPGRLSLQELQQIFSSRGLSEFAARDFHSLRRDERKNKVPISHNQLFNLSEETTLATLDDMLKGVSKILLQIAQWLEKHEFRELTDDEVQVLFHYFLLGEQHTNTTSEQWYHKVVAPVFNRLLVQRGLNQNSIPNVEIDYTLTNVSPHALVEGLGNTHDWINLDPNGSLSRRGIIANSLSTEQKRDLINKHTRLFSNAFFHAQKEEQIAIGELALIPNIIEWLNSLIALLSGMKSQLDVQPATAETAKQQGKLELLLQSTEALLNQLNLIS